MADGLNKVQLIGNLGADPEVRYSGSGKAVVELRLATAESWKDKDGNRQEHTEWHRVVFFGKTAEIIGEFCTKGRQLYVEGRIRTEEYEKDGVKRYATKIMGDQFRLLGGRPADGGSQRGGARDDASSGGERRQYRGAPSRHQPPPRGQEKQAPAGNDFYDDDIPF
jgi:single-strand DNA-binding protein